MSKKFNLSMHLMEPCDVQALIEAVTYDGENVEAAAQDQPRLYLEAARYHSQKHRRMQQAKMQVKEIEASCEIRVREKLIKDSNGERITEARITAAVALDREVKEAKRKFIRTETLELYTGLMLEAYKMRRDGIAHKINLQMSELRMQKSLEGDTQMEKVKKKLKNKYPGDDD